MKILLKDFPGENFAGWLGPQKIAQLREVVSKSQEAEQYSGSQVDTALLNTLVDEVFEMTGTSIISATEKGRMLFSKGALKSLDLSRLGLSAIPRCITRFPKLQNLDLSNNKIKEIPPGLESLTSLEFLNLGGNSIYMLDENIAAVPHLKVLILEDNFNLHHVNQGFTRLSTLKELHLSSTAIQSTCITHLTSFPTLEILDMNFGGVVGIDDNFQKLRSLKELRLKCCKLFRLPSVLSKLENLETLDITENDFKKVPAVVFKMKTLKNLQLGKNPFVPRLKSKVGSINFNNPLSADEISLLRKGISKDEIDEDVI